MAKSSSRRERRQKARRLGVLTDAQVALGWFVILALCALIGAVYVSQASRIAYVGRQVQLRQNELDRLKRENSVLEREIAEAQSLDRLMAEAERMGFVRAAPEDIQYVVIRDVPAPTSKVETPTTNEDEAPPVETMGEALWLTLRGSITDMVRGESGE